MTKNATTKKIIKAPQRASCATIHGMNLKDIKGAPVGSFHTAMGLVKSVEEKSGKTTEFLLLTLTDKTGEMDIRVFQSKPTYAKVKALKAGMLVGVYGQIGRFKENFSFEYSSIADANIAEYDPSEFIAASPVDEKVLRAEFERLLSGRPKDMQIWVWELLAGVPEYFTGPGAFCLHHAYRYGLLEHSVNVARIVEKLQGLYSTVNIDIAIVGALLHDIGKAREFAGIVPTHTDAGRLYGHITLGMMIINGAPDVSWRQAILHITASHHGQIEHGAAVLPATVEAILVSFADNIDAKMGMAEQAIRESTGDWSEYNKALGTRLKCKSI